MNFDNWEIQRLKQLDEEVKRIRDKLRLDRAGEKVWEYPCDGSVVSVVADGYGGGVVQRTCRDGRGNIVVLSMETFQTVERAIESAEASRGGFEMFLQEVTC